MPYSSLVGGTLQEFLHIWWMFIFGSSCRHQVQNSTIAIIVDKLEAEVPFGYNSNVLIDCTVWSSQTKQSCHFPPNYILISYKNPEEECRLNIQELEKGDIFLLSFKVLEDNVTWCMWNSDVHVLFTPEYRISISLFQSSNKFYNRNVSVHHRTTVCITFYYFS